jgi:hypothetical protein
MILAVCLIIVGVFLVGSIGLGILAIIYWFFKHWLWWLALFVILLLLAH